MSKDLKQYLQELRSKGWKIERTKKQTKLRSPEGQLFTCSLTPSCPNAHKQLFRDIRRYLKKEKK